MCRLGGLGTQRALLYPDVQFRLVSMDGAAFVVELAVDWQPLFHFPADNGPHRSTQILGDLLPGIQTVARVSFRVWHAVPRILYLPSSPKRWGKQALPPVVK